VKILVRSSTNSILKCLFFICINIKYLESDEKCEDFAKNGACNGTFYQVMRTMQKNSEIQKIIMKSKLSISFNPNFSYYCEGFGSTVNWHKFLQGKIL
jgi:hypothetical protein